MTSTIDGLVSGLDTTSLITSLLQIEAAPQTLLKTKDGQGRVAAHEIMVGTPAIRNLIRENKVAQMYSSIQTGQQYGMQTLDQCLQDLVRRNQISPSEARPRAVNKDLFPGN